MGYKDPQKNKEYRRQYYLKHKERLLRLGRKWKRDHQEQNRKSNIAYREKIRNDPEKYAKQKQKAREWFLKNRTEWCLKARQRHQTRGGKYLAYRRGAKNRRITFKLSEDEFKLYWKKPCYYCNSSIKTIGLDRIDCTKGYFIGNIRSCCKWCNYMKSNKSEKEFLDHCFKIINKLTDYEIK